MTFCPHEKLGKEDSAFFKALSYFVECGDEFAVDQLKGICSC